MKKTLSAIVLIMALASCQKTVTLKEVTNENNTETQALSEKYGASVLEGTLKFESSEKYLELLNMDQSEKEVFFDLLSKIPNFTSKNELVNSNIKNKSTTDCNCFIDDEYTNSIVNSNYMVVINNFLIKLDGCNNKVYVSDELAANANDRKNAFLACNFNRSDIWVYTFDHAVEDELQILRDSINGNPNARLQIGCKEVAISRRYAKIDAGTTPSGQVFPAFDLEYNNFGISGRIRAQLGVSNNGSQWSFEWQNRHYKQRCGPVTNASPAVSGKTLSGSVYKFDVHNGTRLTNAPTSTNYLVKMRLMRSSPNDATAFVQIVP